MKHVKKLICLLMILTLVLTTALSSCQSNRTSSNNTTDDGNQAASTPEVEQEEEPAPIKSDFELYQSNVAYGTGNNIMIYATGQTETATYRAVFPVQEHGAFDYKLYFSNNMDASSRGFANYPDMPTADYTIHYAALRTTTDIKGMSGISEPTPITFDGQPTRTVSAGESFWCDAVAFEVPEGSYLMYEWTVEYTCIPSTIVASTYSVYKANTSAKDFPSNPQSVNTAPMPDLIGCTRDGVRLAFIGDSITMGTGSGAFEHAFWVKQISDRLGTGYSVWNLGLDSGRANDVVIGSSWKEKLKNTDILSICIGINDVMSIYGGNPQAAASASAEDIVASITQIAAMADEAGAKVILFTIPPFNLSGEKLTKWQTANAQIKELAEAKGYQLFDFAAVLGDPNDPAKCIYGDHPNKMGCTAVADAFMAANILAPKD